MVSNSLTLLISAAWVLGGMTYDSDITLIIGTGIAILWLIVGLSRRPSITISRSFQLFSLFLALESLSLIWSFDRLHTLRSILLLASGGIWWLAAAVWQQADPHGKVITRSICLVGVIFAILWALKILFNWQLDLYGPSSLIVEASAYKNHNHIGDWWMMIATLELWQWSNFLLPALALMVVSRSRSALIGLASGWGFWWFTHRSSARKHRLLAALAAVGLIVLLLGSHKSSLSARDYYIQALAGLVKYPWGVGLGNFGSISQDTSTHWWGKADFSSVVHNLPLEWSAGAGVLALSGWIWLGHLSWQLGKDGSSRRNQWRSLYWALLINFLLDTTYFIPSMWWVFMVVIAFAEPRSSPDHVPVPDA